jgi:hypothetical protein
LQLHVSRRTKAVVSLDIQAHGLVTRAVTAVEQMAVVHPLLHNSLDCNKVARQVIKPVAEMRGEAMRITVGRMTARRRREASVHPVLMSQRSEI